MNKVLVVIDMQVNFIKECGAERIIPKVAEKIKRRREEGYGIVLTLDRSGGDLDGSVSSICNGDRAFEKRSYGCEELILYLKELNPDVVEFVGICTDICVICNVLAAVTFLPSAEIVVDSGCCASEGAGHLAALCVMKACNITVID